MQGNRDGSRKATGGCTPTDQHGTRRGSWPPQDEIMSAAEWSRVLSKNLLAPLERRDNRYHLGARRLHVDCLEDLLGDFDCRQGSTLELGCGTGLDSVGLHDRLGCSSGMLVDFCPEAVSIARTNARGRDLDVVKSHVLDFATDRRFDVAFSVGLVEHFRGQALLNVLRKHGEFLRPDGRAMILAPLHGWLWPLVRILNSFSSIRESPPSRKGIRKTCVDAGFSVLRVKTYLFGVWVGVLLENRKDAQVTV
jgi:SAM-dependent methyltransferase